MNVEFSKEDLQLMDMLLSKAEGVTRVEIHHCSNHDYKDFLKARETQIGELLGRIKNALVVSK